MTQTREQFITTTTTDTIAVVPPLVSVIPAADTTGHVEPFTGNPGISRREVITQAVRVIWLVLAFGEILLLLRFSLRLLGANPEVLFAQFIYGISTPFIIPFAGLFGTPRFEGSSFEFTTLIAMFIYAVLAWGIVKVMRLFLNDTRTDTLNVWTDPPSSS